MIYLPHNKIDSFISLILVYSALCGSGDHVSMMHQFDASNIIEDSSDPPNLFNIYQPCEEEDFSPWGG